MMLLLYNPDWIAYIVNVETAFLYGKMDVDLYGGPGGTAIL